MTHSDPNDRDEQPGEPAPTSPGEQPTAGETQDETPSEPEGQE